MTEVKRPKTGGRKAGTPNKTTAAVKDAILEAFEAVGGAKYLQTVAREDFKTFCTLLSKVMPMQITGEDGGAVKLHQAIEIRIVDPQH